MKKSTSAMRHKTLAKMLKGTRYRIAKPKGLLLAYTGRDGKRTTVHVPNLRMLIIVLRDEALYEKYAKHLESTHKGKYVAISLKGELIITDEMTDAFLGAVAKFGPRKFAVAGIGFEATIRA